jgi:hypothetical protein
LQQAAIHKDLSAAEQLRHAALLRSLKLEAFQVTARIRETLDAIVRHGREAHPAVRAA